MPQTDKPGAKLLSEHTIPEHRSGTHHLQPAFGVGERCPKSGSAAMDVVNTNFNDDRRRVCVIVKSYDQMKMRWETMGVMRTASYVEAIWDAQQIGQLVVAQNLEHEMECLLYNTTDGVRVLLRALKNLPEGYLPRFSGARGEVIYTSHASGS